ncbi:MAG: hypothetical protein O7H41_16260 [Planctomycetota bacterium]|nr:hypothetical protein [Planctomycetota bacterium]
MRRSCIFHSETMGRWDRGWAALLVIGAFLTAGTIPGTGRAQDLEMKFARGLMERGPAFYGLGRTVAARIEADSSRTAGVRADACFLIAKMYRLEAQSKGDDEILLKKFEEQIARCKQVYPKSAGARGADFTLLRSEVAKARAKVGSALTSEDPEKIAAARRVAKVIFEDSIAKFGEMIQKIQRQVDANPKDGEAKFKRDQAELIEADTLYGFAINMFDENDPERKSHLEKALQKYDFIVEERFEFQNLLAYGYMGRGKVLFELGRLADAADQFDELTYFTTGLDSKDEQFQAAIRALENVVRLEAFFMSLATRLKAGEVDAALQTAVELFGTWLATVEGLRKNGPGDDPKEVRYWVTSYLTSEAAEQALKMAEDAAAARKRGAAQPLGGRTITGVRDAQIRHGIRALMETARAVARAGDFDRAGGLLMAVIEDSREREPKVSPTDLDIFGYTACTVLSEILEEGGVILPADAAFYAGQGFFFRSKNDAAIRAFRMSIASGARTSESDFPARALYEMGTIYYAEKKAYLEAGIAFKTLAARYRDHLYAAEAARRAEKAFNKLEGNGDWIRRLREEAISLVQRSGQGVAPERHRFERGERLFTSDDFLKASEEFLGVLEVVSTSQGDRRVPFYLIARIKGGECLGRAFRADPESARGKQHLEKALQVLKEGLEKAAAERDIRSWALGCLTLGSLLASKEVADYGAAAEVLSALDREPALQAEDSQKGWGFVASARERQVHSLAKLGRLDEAESAFAHLEEGFLAREGGNDALGRAERMAGFQAAWTLAAAMQDKGEEDPAGGWESRAGTYGVWVAKLGPPTSAKDEFKRLAWAAGLVFAGGLYKEAIPVYERMLEAFKRSGRDKINLKDGTVISGEILEEDLQRIKILVDETVETIEKVIVNRTQKGVPKDFQQIADTARTDLAECLVKIVEAEKAMKIFKFLYDRPIYSGEYRVLEGYAEAQLLMFEKTKDDRYLGAQGAARDLFQRLFGKLKGAEEEGYLLFKRPTDPPYWEKRWLLMEKILICAFKEGKNDPTKYDWIIESVDGLELLEGLAKKDFEFPKIRDRIQKLRDDSMKRAR